MAISYEQIVADTHLQPIVQLVANLREAVSQTQTDIIIPVELVKPISKDEDGVQCSVIRNDSKSRLKEAHIDTKELISINYTAPQKRPWRNRLIDPRYWLNRAANAFVLPVRAHELNYVSRKADDIKTILVEDDRRIVRLFVETNRIGTWLIDVLTSLYYQTRDLAGDRSPPVSSLSRELVYSSNRVTLRVSGYRFVYLQRWIQAEEQCMQSITTAGMDMSTHIDRNRKEIVFELRNCNQ
jgi:hypothetical protein